MRLALTAAVAVLLLATYCSGCGFTTHNVVANRALHYFYNEKFAGYADIMNKYPQFVLGGAPFPDYLYTCGKNHDAGEAAHWPPFHAAAANYIRARPRPWDEPTQQLVAFMMGAISHYIADVNWHGLEFVPNGYGFIQTLGTTDFNCTGNLCSVAHTAADTGGEFVAAYQTDLSWFSPDKWGVPIQDMVNVYQMINYTVTSSDIGECQLLFAAGALAIKYVGELAFMSETGKAPFLVEHYIDFPLGGIDDMAIWTGRMWNRFAEWIEQGPPSPVPPILLDNVEGITDLPARAAAYSTRQRARGQFVRAMSDLVDTAVVRQMMKGEATLDDVRRSVHATLSLRDHPAHVTRSLATIRSQAPSLHVDRLIAHARTVAWSPAAPALHSAPAPAATAAAVAVNAKVVAQYTGDAPLSYLGNALTSGDFNQDGYPDLVTSSYGHTRESLELPQEGAVYIQWGTNASSPAPPTTTLLGGMTYGRFGWALTTLDYNMDGVDDLVVSAPTAGWDWSNISVIPNYHYRGSVYVFFGRPGTASFPATADYIIQSQTDLDHFGYVLKAADVNGDGHADLLVGSPLSRGLKQQGTQQGMVQAYVSSTARVSGGVIPSTQTDLAVDGQSNFEWFGQHMEVVLRGKEPLLVVGAPNRRTDADGTIGAIYAFSLQDYITTGVFDSTPLFTIRGNAQQSQFGWAFAYGAPITAGASLLAVSAPSQNEDSTQFSGQVVLFSIDGLKGDYTLDSITATTVFHASDYGARLGWGLSFNDVNGDGIDDLLMSAPFLSPSISENAHQRGSMLIFKGGPNFIVGVRDLAQEFANWRMDGGQNFGRFGYSFTVMTSNNGTSVELAVGAPRVYGSVLSQEMLGQVTVYKGPFF